MKIKIKIIQRLQHHNIKSVSAHATLNIMPRDGKKIRIHGYPRIKSATGTERIP